MHPRIPDTVAMGTTATTMTTPILAAGGNVRRLWRPTRTLGRKLLPAMKRMKLIIGVGADAEAGAGVGDGDGVAMEEDGAAGVATEGAGVAMEDGDVTATATGTELLNWDFFSRWC